METRIRRSERLKSKRAIDQLFREGSRIRKEQLLLRYLLKEGDGKLRFGVGAPKKRLRKAHQRNRTKRLMREAIRPELPKLRSLLHEQNKEADLFFLYQGRNVPEWQELQDEMIELLRRWEKEIGKG